ncbi:MAG: hypothetical protein K6F68_07050 [Clostridiales bacterium]|nr:hypothetical protein [Clostridiales bacterium]
MYRAITRALALLLAAALLMGLSACRGKTPAADTAYTPTAKEAKKITELAKAFRIYGAYDADKGVPASKAEELIYCIYTCVLPESDVRGYGKVAISETDELIKRMIGFDAKAMMRTKYKPSEVQLIYTVGDSYCVFRSDSSKYVFEITRADLVLNEAGEREGVKAIVKVTGAAGVFSLSLTLKDDDMFVFTVRKCEVQYYE